MEYDVAQTVVDGFVAGAALRDCHKENYDDLPSE
jgi:hypothetical protein